MKQFKGADLVTVGDLDMTDLQRVMQVAETMLPYAGRQKITRVLDGAVLANLFFEPSTRTRVSFGAAFNRLGGSVCDTTGVQFSSIIKGESLHDTARVISGYSDIMTVRHPEAGSVQQFADATSVPVINGGDGPGEHPTQGLLDLFTLHRELPQIDGMTIAMVGDLKFGRTVHSLARLLCLYRNITFKFVAPEAIQMPEDIREHIQAVGHGHRMVVTEDLLEGIADADVVYSTRIQEERFESPEAFARFRGRYTINRQLVRDHLRPSVLLLHPLPRDSRLGADELSHDLNGLENLGIFRQTDNGIPIRMAVFALLMGVEDRVQKHECPVHWFTPSQNDPDYPDPVRKL